jgi:NTP pyrophosphatase (non-canonical NTP hydrolase)
MSNIDKGVVLMRTQLNDEQITNAISKTIEKLQYRLRQKGYGTFSSKHEILGVITEEYSELVNAVHGKNYNEMKEELLDIAVGSIFGLACIEENTIDW